MLIVTATDLPRLMSCNGSRLMGGAMPPVETNDAVRDEGNAAHWVVQKIWLGEFTAEELIDRKAPNGIYVTSEMMEYLDEYIKAATSNKTNAIEIDMSHNFGAVWQVNGRADLVKYNPVEYHLEIADLKYGWSIVEPENNWTLISHIFGFMVQNPKLRVDTAMITIYQPRPHHANGRVRSWPISRAQLNELYEQLNNTLSNPSDALNTSPHCYRCPALAICPAARKAQFNAIEASEKAFVDNIDNVNLSFQLDHLARAQKFLDQIYDAYSELALHRMKEGQIIQNYSIENEMTNRVWKEGVTPELIQMMTGRDLTKKKELITPAQAEKQGVPKEVVAAFTERRQKGFKLIRANANDKAKKMFGE